MDLFQLQNGLMFFLWAALVLVKGWALIDAVTRRTDAFTAADKMTKTAWLWITGLSLVAEVVLPGPLGFVSLIGTVASLVYLLDVRPAVQSVTRR